MTEPSQAEPETSYSESVNELDEILSEIESGNVDIDTLSVKVERAAALLKTCREKLAGSEMRVTKIIEQLEADETRSQEADA